jgi:hypothetical protein
MGGLLTHLIVALAGFLIGTFIFKNYKYGLAFAFGQLISDLIDFGIAGIKQGSLNPAKIMTNPWFQPLEILGHTWWHWIIFGSIFLIIIECLYKFKKISNKAFKTWFIILIFFLIGVAIHILIIDPFIIERSYWI